MTAPTAAARRCAAAHPQDPSGCEGPHDAVRVVDQLGGEALGCVRHAAVLVASLSGALVRAGSVEGAATEAFNRALRLRPLDFTSPMAGGSTVDGG